MNGFTLVITRHGDYSAYRIHFTYGTPGPEYYLRCSSCVLRTQGCQCILGLAACIELYSCAWVRTLSTNRSESDPLPAVPMEREKLGLEERIAAQLEQLHDNRTPFNNRATESSQDMIYMNLKQNGALLTEDNAVEIITDGTDKFQRLLDDIEAAQDHVHVQYYIYRGDRLGKRIRDALIRKAREGIKVRLLYDALGSRRVSNRFSKNCAKQAVWWKSFSHRNSV